MAQRNPVYHHNKSKQYEAKRSEADMTRDTNTLFDAGISLDSLKSFIADAIKEKNAEGKEKKDDDWKSLIETVTPLTGGFFVPSINAKYEGRIGLKNRAVISSQLFIGDDLKLEGDTLGSSELRDALGKGYFVPEASNFRLNVSFTYAFNKWRIRTNEESEKLENASTEEEKKKMKQAIRDHRKDSLDKSGTALSDKAMFVGAFVDIVSKRIPIDVNPEEDQNTWEKENYEMVYLTLSSQYRLVGADGFQIGLYGDLGFILNATGYDQIENYFKSSLENGSIAAKPNRVTIAPKLGIETVFKNFVFDIGYIFSTESKYFISNDPGFFTVKVGTSTKFKRG